MMDTKLLSTDRPISVYYCFITDVDSIEKKADSSIEVSFKAGSNWKLIHTTIGTIDFIESSERANGNTLFKSTLNAIVPGHDSSSPLNAEMISGRKALIRLDYKSGLKKLVGNLKSAPRIFIRTTSNQTTSRKIESEWKSLSPNYILS